MRHSNRNKKFGRTRKVRTGLIKSLVVALVDRNMIKTTETKAKALRPIIERMITHAKKGGISNIRLLNRSLVPASVLKMIKEIAPKYKDRNGGYTRIVKIGRRRSDGASMAYIEFV